MSVWNEVIENYFIRYSDKIKQVTRPLRDHFDISFFYYGKIDGNGNYTLLGDRPDWIEFQAIEKIFQVDPYLRHPKFYFSEVCSPEANGADSYDKAVYEIRKKFSFDPAILLIEKELDAVEFMGFAGKKGSYLSELSLNHPNILKSFGKHFKKEMNSVLSEIGEGQIHLPDVIGDAFFTEFPNRPILPSLNLFLEELGMRRELKLAKSLSRRETQCLKLLLQGKSAYETALDLSLSPRTVEFYFENIKNKLTCQSKHDLFFIAKDLQGLGLL